MHVSYDDYGIVRAVSETPISAVGRKTVFLPDVRNDVIGKRIVFGTRREKIKLAVICNWGDRCGIANYAEKLLGLLGEMTDLKIFAEDTGSHDPAKDREQNVVRCWRRGESMTECLRQIREWQPDVISIQHEFGLFPKATHFLKMLELLDEGAPYVITMHSVYEHLDKTICTAYIRNMIVHSDAGKASLRRHGHLNDVFVIPHGCTSVEDHSELWNIFQNDYAVIQFGFGFNYKGVDVAIDAIHRLKTSNEKFQNIFYCYLCSESPHTKSIQRDYYRYLSEKVQALGLENNVAIVRGFLSEKHISNFLRTAKLAIFPYKNDPTNVVYGASGAVRNAMANGIPVIASDCHLFDDMQGVLPRISNETELAEEIDRIFSDWEYRRRVVQQGLAYVQANSWRSAAEKHLAVFSELLNKHESELLRVPGPIESQ